MAGDRVAVVGVGQTVHRTARKDVSMAGLVREAAQEALDDAGMTWSDIDAVVLGKAPDMFEGVAMPELYLADALGAVGKPMIRVHTAGSVGGSTAIVAAKLIAAGVHERVLTVAYEKQSESNATWGLSVPMPFAAPLVAGAGGFFAPLIRAYMYRSGAPRYIGHLVAVKDRLAALRNPKAHLHIPDIDLKMVEESFLLWDPLRYLDVCPSSDGAMAMVLGSEKVADAAPGPVAWVHGMAMRSEPTMFARRDQVSPQAGQGLRQGRVRAGGRHRSAQGLRLCRGVRAVLVVRADVAREPRVLRGGRRLEADRVGRDRTRRRHPVEHVGRRAVVEPDRRVGHGALRRGRAAGARACGRLPGRAEDGPRARAGVRRWLAVLLDVGGREQEAVRRTTSTRVREVMELADEMRVDELVELFADDAVMELPFAPGKMARSYEGKAAIGEFQRFARDSFSELLDDGRRDPRDGRSERGRRRAPQRRAWSPRTAARTATTTSRSSHSTTTA